MLFLLLFPVLAVALFLCHVHHPSVHHTHHPGHLFPPLPRPISNQTRETSTGLAKQQYSKHYTVAHELSGGRMTAPWRRLSLCVLALKRNERATCGVAADF